MKKPSSRREFIKTGGGTVIGTSLASSDAVEAAEGTRDFWNQVNVARRFIVDMCAAIQNRQWVGCGRLAVC